MSIVRQEEMRWREENREKSANWCDPYKLVLISIMRKRKDYIRTECMLPVAMEMKKKIGLWREQSILGLYSAISLV